MVDGIISPKFGPTDIYTIYRVGFSNVFCLLQHFGFSKRPYAALETHRAEADIVGGVEVQLSHSFSSLFAMYSCGR